MEIRLEDYDFELPEQLIAQEPAAERDRSRLLVLDRARPDLSLTVFSEIGRFLRPGDLLVLNDTRVFPARLRARRATGGAVEVFLLSPSAEKPELWEALVQPARAARTGEGLAVEFQREGDGWNRATARGVKELGGGRFLVELAREGVRLDPAGVFALCEAAGETPLPPYIHRERHDPRLPVDRERYQTVYARRPGAVAAPTAGLHFTADLLDSLRAAGVLTTTVTLDVGLGTFLPLRDETIRAGKLHEETLEVTAESASLLESAAAEGRRVIPVGTTACRAIESWARAGRPRPSVGKPWRTRTDLFIAPGQTMQLTQALVTNFHLPRSSLLLLVAALAGRERVLDAYRVAVREGFRFYSFGDAMLVL